METEEWRPIPKYPSYEASSLGRIRRTVAKRNWPAGLIKRTSITRIGYGRSPYEVIALSNADGVKTIKVHRIIAAVFLGETPTGGEVNHRDGNGLNNAVSNLEYIASHSANMKHAFAELILPYKHTVPRLQGEQHGRAILTEDDVCFIRAHPEIRAIDFATQFGVSKFTIHSVRRTNGSWSHIR